MVFLLRVKNDRTGSVGWQFWEERVNKKFVLGHKYLRAQQLSTGLLFYQPQTPVIAMIKANKIITEAISHFLTLIAHSFLFKL